MPGFFSSSQLSKFAVEISLHAWEVDVNIGLSGTFAEIRRFVFLTLSSPGGGGFLLIKNGSSLLGLRSTGH